MKAGILAKKSLKSLPCGTIDLLKSFDVIFASSDFGGQLIPNVKLIDTENKNLSYKDKLEAVVFQFLNLGIDVLVTIGGDGLASYAASAVIKKQGPKPVMLGFAGGTANVGPIVDSQNAGKTPDSLQPVLLDALEISCQGKVLSYAFNDLIIGDSFLGTTKEGKVANFCAKALAQDNKLVITNPSDNILREDFKFSLNNQTIAVEDPLSVKQICASTMKGEKFAGRAIFGGLLNGAYQEHPAAIAFFDRIIVDSRPENWNYKGFVKSQTLCFEDTDLVEMSGFTENAQIIIDGNPFIREDQKVQIKCIKGAISALRSAYER